MSAHNTPGAEIVPYEPPAPMFNDTMLAFRAISRDPWLNPSVSLHITPDPLGGPNRILSLMRNDRDGSTRIGKSVLYPVRKGTEVSLSLGLAEDGVLDDVWAYSRYSDVWAVTVDDKRILEVPYAAALPDVPPAPRTPLKRRLRSWATKRARSAADGLAGRLGYHREDECGGDW